MPWTSYLPLLLLSHRLFLRFILISIYLKPSRLLCGRDCSTEPRLFVYLYPVCVSSKSLAHRHSYLVPITHVPWTYFTDLLLDPHADIPHQAYFLLSSFQPFSLDSPRVTAAWRIRRSTICTSESCKFTVLSSWYVSTMTEPCFTVSEVARLAFHRPDTEEYTLSCSTNIMLWISFPYVVLGLSSLCDFSVCAACLIGHVTSWVYTYVIFGTPRTLQETTKVPLSR